MESRQLSCLKLGQLLTLQDFVKQHAFLTQQAQQLLQDVVSRVVATAKSACEESVSAMERELVGGGAEKQAAPAARSVRAFVNTHYLRLLLRFLNQD